MDSTAGTFSTSCCTLGSHQLLLLLLLLLALLLLLLLALLSCQGQPVLGRSQSHCRKTTAAADAASAAN